MSYSIEFVILGLPKMSNQLLRGHWRVKHAHATNWKKYTRRAVELNGALPAQPLVSAALRLVRVSSNEPDFDGLVSGFKPIIDGLVECGVLLNDKPSCIKSEYLWERGPRGKGSVRVQVREVSKEATNTNDLEAP